MRKLLFWIFKLYLIIVAAGGYMYTYTSFREQLNAPSLEVTKLLLIVILLCAIYTGFLLTLGSLFIEKKLKLLNGVFISVAIAVLAVGVYAYDDYLKITHSNSRGLLWIGFIVNYIALAASYVIPWVYRNREKLSLSYIKRISDRLRALSEDRESAMIQEKDNK